MRIDPFETREESVQAFLRVEQARHDVGLPSRFRASIRIGGRIALWEGFLPRWVGWMRQTAPDVSVHSAIGFEEDLMRRLIEGTLDIGWLGVQLILANGGSCFLPIRMAQPLIDAGRVFKVDEGPEIDHPVYMVFPRTADSEVTRDAVQGLRELAREERQ